ncbi:MAG: hypothetical protein LBS06_03990 [Treponema sp.]|jgi:hypothetical protein|nr:hypothetical protein [Treponema sp.]
MKKFVFTFLILGILAGLAFFFGWVQLEVPPGSFGVLRSKTHGLDRRPVREGEFRWAWYKLIPGNAQITVFRPERKTVAFSFSGALPSAAVYTSFAGIDADFSWSLSGSFSFSLDGESLISLIETRGIGNQKELDAWENTLGDEIRGSVLRYFGKIDGTGMEEIIDTGTSSALEADIGAANPFIRDFSLYVQEARFPDLPLYHKIQGMFEDHLALQGEFFSAGLRERAENRVNSQFRFDELDKYGELLTRYPVLLRYLAMEKGLPDPGE